MSRYKFELKQKELIDSLRSPAVYQYNMAENLALLSNDVSTIRRFYQVGIARYFQDTWLAEEARNKFLGHYEAGQAFAYFGLIPMIVQGVVNLVASNGFECKSDNAEVDEVLNRIKDRLELEKKFADGVWLESGLGDCAFRISYHKDIDKYAQVDIVEPQFMEVNYKHGKIKSIVIKEVSEQDPNYELREIHYKNADGYACIKYKFWFDGGYVEETDENKIKECRLMFPDEEVDLTPMVFPLRDLLVVFKKNNNASKIYRGERGVPDIQGLASIEDALTETISDLIDAIRKGGVKEYISDQLLPQDIDGRTQAFDPFNKTIITTKGSSTPAESTELHKVVQSDIHWEAYTRTIQNLMSVAINKAGLAPTTLGLTGLESINSSAESQDAREKTSMRKRALSLLGWEKTLKQVLNILLQCEDCIAGCEPMDYWELINISFNEYTNPTLENITDVLATQVSTGLKSRQTAIQELNDGWTEEQAIKEYNKIVEEGTPPQEEDEEQTINGQGKKEQII